MTDQSLPEVPGPSFSEVPDWYRYYVLGLLSLVYVFNFIDRQVLAMLLQPIKEEFGVSDTLMGLLSGFAFVVFYTFAGIPIARWADRASRRMIITVALSLWSAMTAASGLVRSFAQLALARILVGVGEAGGSPPAHSLISDYFPPAQRGTALSIYAWGVYIGAAIAFLGGGYLTQYFGWRTAFIVVGVPGLVLALVVRLTIREVPRGFSEGGRTPIPSAPFGTVLRFLLTRRSFVFVVLASSVQSLSGYGVITWGPTFLLRVHDMSWIEIGWKLGWLIGVAGCGGAYLGGKIADALGSRDARWNMRLPAIESVLGVPFLIGFVLIRDADLALVCFAPFYALGAMYVGPMYAMVQGVVKLRMRATAAAILIFVVNIIGLGLGPLLVGMLNDYFEPQYGREAIRYSLLIVGSMGGLASILFWEASRTLREELQDVEDV
jgi:predicted MFS family arabinose efflux permease